MLGPDLWVDRLKPVRWMFTLAPPRSWGCWPQEVKFCCRSHLREGANPVYQIVSGFGVKAAKAWWRWRAKEMLWNSLEMPSCIALLWFGLFNLRPTTHSEVEAASSVTSEGFEGFCMFCSQFFHWNSETLCKSLQGTVHFGIDVLKCFKPCSSVDTWGNCVTHRLLTPLEP